MTPYQRQHISVEDGEKAEEEILVNDNENDDQKYNQIMKRKSRRGIFYISIFVLFCIIFGTFAIFLHTRNKNVDDVVTKDDDDFISDDDGNIDIDNDDDDGITTSKTTIHNHITHDDDDTFIEADDDSVRVHDQPIVVDAKTMKYIKKGKKHLKKLSEKTFHTNATLPGCETTILLMRHCEKGGKETTDINGNEHCDWVGHERSYFLPSLFGPDNNTRWPIPSYLFALSPIRDSRLTFRSVETLLPLANRYGLDINQDFETNKELRKELFHLMSTGETCGKLIIVNWRHHMMPHLAKKLGCTTCPDIYPQDSFDQVWQLKYVWDVANTDIYRINNGYVQEPPSPKLRRNLKTKKKTKKKTIKAVKKDKYKGPRWSLYSTITYQSFDPLQFSGVVGDYKNGGVRTGAQWLLNDESEGEM